MNNSGSFASFSVLVGIALLGGAACSRASTPTSPQTFEVAPDNVVTASAETVSDTGVASYRMSFDGETERVEALDRQGHVIGVLEAQMNSTGTASEYRVVQGREHRNGRVSVHMASNALEVAIISERDGVTSRESLRRMPDGSYDFADAARAARFNGEFGHFRNVLRRAETAATELDFDNCLEARRYTLLAWDLGDSSSFKNGIRWVAENCDAGERADTSLLRQQDDTYTAAAAR